MNTNGWIKLHRAVLSSDLWLNEQFTYGQAWIDLLLLATSKPTDYQFNGFVFHLEAGDVVGSATYFCQRWGWTVKRFRAFKMALKRTGKADYRNSNKGIVISIQNWSEYQARDTQKGRQKGRQKGTPYIYKENKKKEERREINGSALNELPIKREMSHSEWLMKRGQYFQQALEGENNAS